MTQQPPPGPDKVQREIEELLDRLDNFVPEERLATKIRSRARQQQPRGEPGFLQRTVSRLRRVSYGQMVLAGLALIVIVFFLRGPLGGVAGPLMIAGLVLAVVGFALSVISGGSGRTLGTGGRVEKRWRGQVLDYSEPSTLDRLRGWFRGKRNR